MKRLSPLALCGLLSCLASSALATDFPESEPNDEFPPRAIGLFQNGDRLTGSILGPDLDLEYLEVAGTGAPGLYRYEFDLSAGGDPFLFLYDSTTDAYTLGLNNDFNGVASRLYFDHFDPTGTATTWGVLIGGITEQETFDYALRVTRTPITTHSLGDLSSVQLSEQGALEQGRVAWYTFDIEDENSRLSLDTRGSEEPGRTTLALFDSQGNILYLDDSAAFGNDYPYDVFENLPAGTYYVAVGQTDSIYNWHPVFTGPLGWDRNGVGNYALETPPYGALQYRLNISYTVTPEPGAFALLAALCVSLLAARRRAVR